MAGVIAVVGNNQQAGDELVGALHQAQYQVLQIRPDVELGESVKRHHPDCVILDLDSSINTGTELVETLRADAEIDKMPIIVLAENASSDCQVAALDAGANLCLNKPWRKTELLSNVAVQLRLWRLQSELQRQLDLNRALLTKLKMDLSLGQQVQQSFLPDFQLRTMNFNLEARFLPSGDLSGDYFDYRMITPDRLVLFLADVSGHGVASALLAGRLKSFFDENSRRAHRPRLLLEKLNQVLIDLGEHYHIATAVFVHIDVVETVLTYASSGHRTLYLIDTESGEHTALAATGPALGMFEEYEIQEGRRSFLPGRNRLVAFTDGLVEFKLPDGTWHTEEQFCEAVILPRYQEQLDQYVNGLLYKSRELNQYRQWEDDVSLMVSDF